MAATPSLTLRERLEIAALRGALRLPERVKRRIAGDPVWVDGRRLDLDFAMARRAAAGLRDDLATTPVARSRRRMLVSSLAIAGPDARIESENALVVPTRSGQVGARLYLPRRSARTGDCPLPLLVHLHGGGWVLGDLDSHAAVCRALCARAEVAVLSVDYRLAPEHPFPAAVHDGVDAFRWALEHAGDLGCDPARVAVGGDSAGGNLAAVVAQVCRDEGTPGPVFQLLLVPGVNPTVRSASRLSFAEGFLLDDASIEWYLDTYLAGHERADVRVSPALATSFAGLPPAYIGVAGFDGLRDEGIAYAEALSAAGVPVTLKVFDGGVHPLFSSLATPLGRQALADAADHLRRALHSRGGGV